MGKISTMASGQGFGQKCLHGSCAPGVQAPALERFGPARVCSFSGESLHIDRTDREGTFCS